MACPHCKQPARRGELTIFAPRGGAEAAKAGAVAGGNGAVAGADTPETAPEPTPPTQPKLGALVSLLAELLVIDETECIVLFGQWQGVLRAAAAQLEASRVPFLTLVGDAVGLAQRMDALRRFGKPAEPRVLLLCSDAHASGLNLQAARHVVLLHPFCPEQAISNIDALRRRSLAEAHAFDAQAIGRVRRFPQQCEVTVHRLFVRGTVEEELLAGQALI